MTNANNQGMPAHASHSAGRKHGQAHHGPAVRPAARSRSGHRRSAFRYARHHVRPCDQSVPGPAEQACALRHLAAGLRRRIRLPRRPFGLGQDHPHAHDHPRDQTDRRPYLHRRRRPLHDAQLARALSAPQHRHGLPGLQAPAQQDGVRKRRLRPRGYRQSRATSSAPRCPKCCAWWACRTSSTSIPTSFPAASSSACRSRARS